MIIVPKISEVDVNLTSSIKDVISSKIEVQMLDHDLNVSFSNSMKCIRSIMEYKTLDEVVFHLPFSVHTFTLYAASEYHLSRLVRMLVQIKEFSIKTNIRFGVVIHQETSLELFDRIPDGYRSINTLLDVIKDSNVYIYVENCLPYLNAGDRTVKFAFELVRKVNHPNLLVCFDICHARCYENILQRQFDIPNDISNKIAWVHFSATLDNDGYVVAGTHSAAHINEEELILDLHFLEENGINIDKVPLVIEVMEEDYINRVNMLKEIELFNNLCKA